MGDKTALRQALQTVTGPRPTRRAVRTVLTRCHRVAHAYLRQRQQSGTLREDLLGGDLEDRALDAIADLFERDAEGRFPELRRYYAERPLAEASPTAVEQDLRRLVAGTVTDWLFRSYTTADRSLANLLQALKRTIDLLRNSIRSENIRGAPESFFFKRRTAGCRARLCS